MEAAQGRLSRKCQSPILLIQQHGGFRSVLSRLARHVRTLENVKLSDALTVGIAQVGALIPGVSRSGSTLTAALS